MHVLQLNNLHGMCIIDEYVKCMIMPTNKGPQPCEEKKRKEKVGQERRGRTPISNKGF